MEILRNINNETLLIDKDYTNVFVKDKSLSLLASLFAISCLAHLSRCFKHKKHDFAYYAKIRTIPSLPLVGCLPHILWHVKDLPNLALSWSEKYGMVFRTKGFGIEFVFLNDPKYLQKLLWSAKPGHLEKPSIFYRFLSAIDKSLATLPALEWKIHRNIIDQAFTYASLTSYFEIFNRHIIKTVADMDDELKLKEKCYQRESDNNHRGLHHFINIATFKIVSEIILGSDCISTEETVKVHECAERSKELMAYRLYHPWLLLNPLWKLHHKSRELDFHFTKAIETLKSVIKRSKERKTSKRLKRCILDYLVDSDLSNEEILPEIIVQFSGHDTVAGTMNFVLFNLALNQEHQEKCRQEVDRLFENKGSNTYLTINDLSELKYVEQCIKETQRLFPTVPFYARELNAPLQLESDVELKRGTIVILSPFLVQRDRRLYPNPEKFDPHRFLPENCTKRSPCAFLPFSHGPRNCIGWKIAQLEMKMLTAYILRNFELTTENTIEIVMEKLRKRFWPCDDFGVQWKKRNLEA